MNSFQEDESPSKKWIPLLYEQITMAEQIYDEFIGGELETSPTNYLSAVSIEALEKIYEEIFYV